MKYKDLTGIVPVQYTGKEVEAEAAVNFASETEARACYNEAKQRLLKVNNWHKIAGLVSAQFSVFDNDGNECNRNIQKDDYIRIDIPGPGSKEGDGYDWVHVEELKEINENSVQSIGFRVRPHSNPLKNKFETAHFYSNQATSCFIIICQGTSITATIIDSNVKPNDEAESLTDKLRHTAIGMAAINSFSKMQWQHLAEGLVKCKQ